MKKIDFVLDDIKKKLEEMCEQVAINHGRDPFAEQEINVKLKFKPVGDILELTPKMSWSRKNKDEVSFGTIEIGVDKNQLYIFEKESVEV